MIWLILILVAGIVLYAMIFSATPKRGSKSYKGSSGPKLSRDQIRSQWTNVMAGSQTGPSGLKNAVSDADRLFDNVLRTQGVHGSTMGERLKAAKSRFGNYSVYDGVWRAHKLRNSLAHDIEFDFVPSQAREALSDFERGLRELGAL